MTGAQSVSASQSIAKPAPYAWRILAVLYLASVASALNQFKVPPVLPVLIQAFNLSLSGAGMLMSIFSVTGLILALPAGFILQRLGLKITGLIAVGAVFIGPIMFGKLAETMGWAGAGYALIPVCAIGIIAVCLAKFR